MTFTDQDNGQTVTLQLLDNTELFSLKEDNTLVAKQSLDYEKQARYNLTIKATDNGSPVASVCLLNQEKEASYSTLFVKLSATILAS